MRHLLLLVAAVLVAATTYLFVHELVSGPSSPRLGTAAYVGSVSTYRPFEDCYTDNQAEAFVALIIEDFNPSNQTVTISPKLCAQLPFFSQLHLLPKNVELSPKATPERSALLPSSQEGTRLPDHTGRLAIGVSLALVGPGTTEEERAAQEPEFHNTTLARLFIREDREQPPAPLRSFVVTLGANPHRYPFDWYAMRADLETGDADGGQFAYCSPGAPSLATCSSSVPTRVELFDDSSLSGYSVRASLSPPSAPDGARVLVLKLERDAVTKLYVVVVALIPLVLGLLLLLVFVAVVPRKRAVGPDAIAGVAAVLLAILPIRLVLVPGDVTILTLVDYWLGIEMAVLAALACLVVWRGLGPARDDDPAKARNGGHSIAP
jgi:hypothetical protein